MNSNFFHWSFKSHVSNVRFLFFKNQIPLNDNYVVNWKENTMAILKCKMCGGDLSVTEGMKIVECDFCGTTQTVPNADDEKKTNLFNRANRLRIASEFDRAAGIYESIIAEFPTEAEAYWGLCLCKYGIEYVDDPRTAEKIPTCHRTSFESIFNDGNYNQAISYSDPVAKNIYESEAKAIDVLQKDILSIVNKEKPFDVFICYKETDDLGNRTVDSVLAQDIYDHLTDRGFKVFFARITLEDKLGQEYEPYIFAALNSAKVMLAIGTNSEYYNAVWVKNEWSRYLSLMHNDRSKTLVPCYRDIDPYDMPPEFKNLQGQDMSKLGFVQDLTRGITKIIRGSADAKSTPSGSAPTGALTKRGYFFLEDGDFVSADTYFDKALDENPEDAKAYVGKVLAMLHKSSVEGINDVTIKVDTFKDLERAIRFSTGAEKAYLEEIRDNAERKYQITCLTVGLSKWAKKKESEEKKKESEVIKENIKKLSAIPTIESYDEIVSICEDAYNRRVDRGYFSAGLVESAKMRANIIRVLADSEEHTVINIQKSKYFFDWYVPEGFLEVHLKEMVKAGSVEAGLSPGSYCIIGVAEKLKQVQNEKLCPKRSRVMPVGNMVLAAFNRTVCVKSDGTVITTKALKNREFEKIIRQTAEWRDIVAISGGSEFTIGLKSDGTVVATEYGEKKFYGGQCDISEWKNIVAISSGEVHTVGLKSDGTVLATKYTGDKNRYAGQCDVSEWADIVAISAGDSRHTVGLKSDGTVVIAIHYKVDQEFYKAFTGYDDDDIIYNVANWKNIVAVSAGNGFIVGLKYDGTVVLAGDRDKEHDVSKWSDIIAISAGYSNVVGLKYNGTVVVTGSNAYGQCDVSGWKDIVAVKSGEHHTIGVKKDGTVLSTRYTFDKDSYDGQCDVTGWKLFNDYNNLQEECNSKRKDRMHIDKQKEEERIRASHRANGKCQYCGGVFKGLFTKKCVNCEKRKDY